MCPLVCPDAGEVLLLSNWLNKTPPQNWYLRLFQNNWTPSELDTAASYTEANFPGYAQKALTGPDWVITGGAPTTAAAAIQTWTCTGGGALQNIYGYYYVQQTSGILTSAERLSGVPFAIQNNGDNVSVTPTITGD